MAAPTEKSFAQNKVGETDRQYMDHHLQNTYQNASLVGLNTNNIRNSPNLSVGGEKPNVNSPVQDPVMIDSEAESDSGSEDTDDDTLDSEPDSESDNPEADEESHLLHSIIAPSFAPLLAWLGINANTIMDDNPSLRYFLDALHGLEDSVNQYKLLLKDYKGLRPSAGKEEAPDKEIDEGCQKIDFQQAHMRDFFQKIAAATSDIEKNQLYGDAALAIVKCDEMNKTVNSQLRVRNWVLSHASVIKPEWGKPGSAPKKVTNGSRMSSPLGLIGPVPSLVPASVAEDNITRFLRWLGINDQQLLTPDVKTSADFMQALSTLSVTITRHFTAQQTAKPGEKTTLGAQHMGEQLNTLKTLLTAVMDTPEHSSVRLGRLQEAVTWIRQCDAATREMTQRTKTSPEEPVLRACNPLTLGWEAAVSRLLIGERKPACFRTVGGMLTAATVLEATLASDVRDVLATSVPGSVTPMDSYLLYQQATEVLLQAYPLIAIYQGTNIMLVNVHRLEAGTNLNQLLRIGLQAGDPDPVRPMPSVHAVVEYVRQHTIGDRRLELATNSGVSLRRLAQHLQQILQNGAGNHSSTNHSAANQPSSGQYCPQYTDLDNQHLGMPQQENNLPIDLANKRMCYSPGYPSPAPPPPLGSIPVAPPDNNVSLDLAFTRCQVETVQELFRLYSMETVQVSAGDMEAVSISSSGGSEGLLGAGARQLVTSGYLVLDPGCVDSSPRGTLHTFTRCLPLQAPSVTSHVGDLYQVLYSAVHAGGPRAVLLTTDAGPGWSPQSWHTLYNLGRLWRDLRLNVLVQTTYAAGHKNHNAVERSWPGMPHTVQGDVETAMATVTQSIVAGRPGIDVITHAVSQADLVYDDHRDVDALLSASIKELRDKPAGRAIRAELTLLGRHATRRHHQLEFSVCTDAACDHCPTVPVTAPGLIDALRRNRGHLPTPTPGPNGYLSLRDYLLGQTVTPIDARLPSLLTSHPQLCARGCRFVMLSEADRSRHDLLFHMSQREAENRKMSRELKRKAASDSAPSPQVCKFRLPGGQTCNETFPSNYQLKRHKDLTGHKISKTTSTTPAATKAATPAATLPTAITPAATLGVMLTPSQAATLMASQAVTQATTHAATQGVLPRPVDYHLPTLSNHPAL